MSIILHQNGKHHVNQTLSIHEGQVISIPNFQRYIQNSNFKNHFQN